MDALEHYEEAEKLLAEAKELGFHPNTRTNAMLLTGQAETHAVLANAAATGKLVPDYKLRTNLREMIQGLQRTKAEAESELGNSKMTASGSRFKLRVIVEVMDLVIQDIERAMK